MTERSTETPIGSMNRRDTSTIGKYLPASSSDIFVDTVQGPDDNFTPPQWMLAAVAEVAALEAKSPLKPGVCFDTDPPALDFNSALLSQYDYNFSNFLAGQEGTTLAYGAEF
jgi:hypothetical protein